jgi:hypothetical protein
MYNPLPSLTSTCVDSRKDDFLRNSLPVQSLIPFVLIAQVSVLPVEHAIDTRIRDLKERDVCT